MRRIQGINNDRGYTKLRIWLGPKRNGDGTQNKPFVKYFGPYNHVNIVRAKNFMDEVLYEHSATRGNMLTMVKHLPR